MESFAASDYRKYLNRYLATNYHQTELAVKVVVKVVVVVVVVVVVLETQVGAS